MLPIAPGGIGGAKVERSGAVAPMTDEGLRRAEW
jgi:hypothetical protein